MISGVLAGEDGIGTRAAGFALGTMSTVPEQWVERAQYDIDTARAMLASERYVYVLFCCQQAVEKMLKAVIAKNTGEMPPRIHNLIRLSEVANVELSDERALFFEELSEFYVASRYPEDLRMMGSVMTRSLAERVASGTQEVFQWLSSML